MPFKRKEQDERFKSDKLQVFILSSVTVTFVTKKIQAFPLNLSQMWSRFQTFKMTIASKQGLWGKLLKNLSFKARKKNQVYKLAYSNLTKLILLWMVCTILQAINSFFLVFPTHRQLLICGDIPQRHWLCKETRTLILTFCLASRS